MHILINSLWIFSIFSFLGWIFQFSLKWIIEKKFVNIGFITLPFSPVSGFGAVIVYLFFYKEDNPVMVFFGAMLLLLAAKFFASMAFERVFGFRWSDNSKSKLKLNKYVTAFDALFDGVIAVLLTSFAFPLLQKLIYTLSVLPRLLIPLAITGLVIADVIISSITVFMLRRNLKQMKNISSLIESDDSCDEKELRAKYERKIVKNKLFRKRLVKAFPDMEFVDYEKQFEDIKIKFNLLKEKNEKAYENKISDDNEKPFAYGLSFTKLFWLFFIGCFLGTVVETIWAFITRGSFEIRTGLVWGPFIPVYGGGAVMITLCLYKLHKAKDIIIYLASALIGAVFEYLCSYFQEYFLGTVSWDYSDTPFNLDGRTNLMFALMWGVLGLCWVRYIYPFFSRSIERIPKKTGNIVTIIVLIFFIIDSALSIVAVYRNTQREHNIPPKTSIGRFADKCFDDEYMDFIYPNMSTTK